MAVYGIISEFNPFHNGHKYLLEKAKSGGNSVICVMSGNFVQRGDTAVFDKFPRAATAAENGADLIIELPTPYAMSEASYFSRGACSLLQSTGIVDTLLFGSECGDIAALKVCSDAVQDTAVNKKVKELLSSGITYAAALSKAVREYYGEIADLLKEPNNMLAAEYINACRLLDFDVDFETVKRSIQHDSFKTSGNFADASYLRELIKSNDIDNAKKFIPENNYYDFSDFSDIDIASRSVLSVLRTRTDDFFSSLPDLSEGIENRLKNAVLISKNLTELSENIKTKRYTLSRVRRLILSAYLGTQNSFLKINPPYIRVLAFGERGEELIKKIKQNAAVPVVVTASEIKKLTGDAKAFFDFECAATDLYGMTFKTPHECGKELTQKIFKRSGM